MLLFCSSQPHRPSATIDGERHVVAGPDPAKPGFAILAAGDRHFSTGIETLRRHFSAR
jgi:hypothetical protein